MGDKTDEFLAKTFQDSFKRETDADEAIWRSLPFFLALLGLAVSVLPAVVRGVTRDTYGGWSLGAWFFLIASGLCFLNGGWNFLRVIRLRNYRYPPPDDEILAYADKLEEAHKGSGAAVDDIDTAVHADVRRIMLEEMAAAATVNRRHNEAKAQARSQVLLAATSGFLLALLAEVMVLGAQAMPLRVESAHGDGNVAPQRAGAGQGVREADQGTRLPAQAGSSEASDRGRGRQLRPNDQGSAGSPKSVSEQKPPAPDAAKPSQAKPQRPAPVYLKKSQDTPLERKG